MELLQIIEEDKVNLRNKYGNTKKMTFDYSVLQNSIKDFTDCLLTETLPKNKHVLQLFTFYHIDLNVTKNESASIVADNLTEVWKNMSVPVREKKNIIPKILKLYSEFSDMKKSAKVMFEKTIKNRNSFIDKLYEIFDVIYTKESFTNNFPGYAIYCKSKGLSRSKLNNQLVNEIKISNYNNNALKKSRKRNIAISQNENFYEDSETDASSIFDDQSADPSYVSPVKKPKENIDKTVVNKLVSDVLDRTDLSNKEASFVISSVCLSLDVDLKKKSTSHETVRRCRNNVRAKNSEEMQSSFDQAKYCTIHWDGKIMLSNDRSRKIDRLAVVATGPSEEFVLGIPELSSSTGEAQAEAVFQLMNEYNLTTTISGMCTDTTASNTGHKKGACTLLQQKLDKKLQYFACRHHMLECIVGSVFHLLFEPSTGPNIQLFERFKREWCDIDRKSFKSSCDDKYNSKIF